MREFKVLKVLDRPSTKTGLTGEKIVNIFVFSSGISDHYMCLGVATVDGGYLGILRQLRPTNRASTISICQPLNLKP